VNKTSLKIIFAGTPEFAATALQALLQTPHQIIAVYTQPDRPAGRGLQVSESAVKALAKQHSLAIFQPSTLKDPAEQEKLAGLKADLMVVAAYGLLLPKAVLTTPHLGCINIHASLLPRWRGAAPIQRALLAGDTKTGITIMQMDEGLDTGPMLYKAECDIGPEDNSANLHDRLAQLGAQALLNSLELLIQDKLPAKPQDPAQASLAAKIRKEEACIDWTHSAQELERAIRAFYPWPIAFTHFQGETLRIHQAQALDQATPAIPGSIISASAQGIDVATKEGLIRIRQIQAPGGRPLSVKDFLNARQKDFQAGARFE